MRGLWSRHAGRLCVPSRPSASAGAPVWLATAVTNVMEWFDFTIYGFLAPTIAHVFFPVATATVAEQVFRLLRVFGLTFPPPAA
jgi:hypothetical protein